MKKLTEKTKHFAKNHPKKSAWIAFVIASAIGVALFSYFVSVTLPSYDLYNVAKADITETVTAQGTVKPSANVDLAFPKSAVISGVYVKEGDVVSKGTVLASLANADLHASLAAAQANLDAEQAKYQTMLSGDREEDLQAKNTAQYYAQNVLADRIHNAYTVADDVVHNQTLPLFTDPRSENPMLSFSFADSSLRITIEGQRKDLEKALADWKSSIDVIDFNRKTPAVYYGDANRNAQLVSKYLDLLAAALHEATPDSVNTSAVLAQYRNSVSLARTNFNTAVSSMVTAQQNEANAESALTLAQAGSTVGDLEAEKARVAQMQAAVDSVNVSIGQTAIVAPIDGVITRVDAKIGAVAQANVPLISLISQGQNQIDVFVSQIDIGKLTIGQKAKVTLDAYGSSVPFSASVTYVGSGNTPGAGAASYKVTLSFDKNDTRIKQGMNANVIIPVAEKIGVIAIPEGSVLSEKGVNYAEVVSGQKLHKQKVETGITGDNGLVEITSGLSAGERIANFGN